MQFDEFYQTIGEFGRFQKIKYFLVCLTYILPPILVYTWTFAAATPNFRCRVSFDDMYDVGTADELLHRYIPSVSECREYKSKISIRECQRCYQSTNKSHHYADINEPLKACTSFIFDRTYYETTLVEEVSSFFLIRTIIIYHYCFF